MNLIGCFVACAVLLVPSAAYGGTQQVGTNNDRITPAELQKTSRQIKRKALPKLRLPDITALTRKLLKAELPVVKKQLTKSHNVVTFWENKGSWIRAPRKEKCWEVPWQRSCTIARASYKLHLTLRETAKQKLWRWLPAPGDFVTAVDVAQRVFPGTRDLVLSCADSEGGRGRWVSNHQGSGAGGWMQFMESTFWRMFSAARTEAIRKGFYVPAEAASWYSPLGQALAGAWGMLNRRSEWSGSGC